MSARTVTLRTIDAGTITIPEPAWCVGHAGHRPELLSDTGHTGPDHELNFRGHQLLTACLVLTPYPQAPRHGGIKVSVGMPIGQSIDPAGLDELAAALVEYAATLRHLARQLAALQTGGAR